jgi:FPC/CPF motif-containing protein YcgG
MEMMYMSEIDPFRPDEELSKIREHGCLMARTGKIRFSQPQWHGHLSLEENLSLCLPSLDEFVREIETGKLDVWIFSINDLEYSRDLSTLAKTLKRTLSFLSDHDPAQNHSIRQNIEMPGWEFSYSKINFFVLVLAPLYPIHHPRSSCSRTLSHFLFQPMESFKRVHTSEARKIKLRARIRKDFRSRDMLLDEKLMGSEIEAYKYIKPINVGDAPIRWWLL